MPCSASRSATAPSGFAPEYCSSVRKYPHGGSARMSSGSGASTSGALGSGGNGGHGYEPRNTIGPTLASWKAIDSLIVAWIAGRLSRWYSRTRLTSHIWP